MWSQFFSYCEKLNKNVMQRQNTKGALAILFTAQKNHLTQNSKFCIEKEHSLLVQANETQMV